MFTYRHFKCKFDPVLAAFLLIVTMPLFFFLALLVRLKLGSPILFKQLRAGFHEEPFYLYKFRSMTESFDRNGLPLPDERRLTPFGSWLRSTSLDELPSLFNILLGDLAFIGPRPLPTSYLPLYSPYELRRHSVLPGLTGLAQSKGRNLLSWRNRFRYDIFYTESFCLQLDLYILFLTFFKVIARHGISSINSVTMLPFSGRSN